MINALIKALILAATATVGAFTLFAYFAGIFLLQYFIGEKIFWGKQYLKQGYKILLSRRLDAYLMDTLAICIASPFAFILCRYGKSAISNTGYIDIIKQPEPILCGLNAR